MFSALLVCHCQYVTIFRELHTFLSHLPCVFDPTGPYGIKIHDTYFTLYFCIFFLRNMI